MCNEKLTAVQNTMPSNWKRKTQRRVGSELRNHGYFFKEQSITYDQVK